MQKSTVPLSSRFTHTPDRRKQDTRRKILVGAYYLKKAQVENTLPHLHEAMRRSLSREIDRCLFDEIQPRSE